MTRTIDTDQDIAGAVPALDDAEKPGFWAACRKAVRRFGTFLGDLAEQVAVEDACVALAIAWVAALIGLYFAA